MVVNLRWVVLTSNGRLKGYFEFEDMKGKTSGAKAGTVQ